MRDIEFRGLMLDGSGKWVYGYYVAFTESTDNGAPEIFYKEFDHTFHTIFEDKDCYEENEEKYIPIKIETLGQYIGCKDINDKKIFEGDIVEHHTKCKNIKNNIFIVKWSTDFFRFYLENIENYNWMNRNIQKNNTYKVIGNIHENPELLKGVKL